MDMLYGLPFRDWMELNSRPSTTETIAAVETEQDSGSGDSADSGPKRKRNRG